MRRCSSAERTAVANLGAQSHEASLTVACASRRVDGGAGDDLGGSHGNCRSRRPRTVCSRRAELSASRCGDGGGVLFLKACSSFASSNTSCCWSRGISARTSTVLSSATRPPAPAARPALILFIATRRRRCIDELEGTCLGKTGYIISITDVKSEDVKPGVIEYDTGYVNFKVSYNAILFRPFKHEVLDARVSTVNEVRASPRDVSFLHLSRPRLLVTQLGFWAEAGPVSVFVSRHVGPTRISLSALAPLVHAEPRSLLGRTCPPTSSTVTTRIRMLGYLMTARLKYAPTAWCGCASKAFSAMRPRSR